MLKAFLASWKFKDLYVPDIERHLKSGRSNLVSLKVYFHEKHNQSYHKYE